MPPTATLVLDACVVVALLVLRPRWEGWPERGPEFGVVLRAAGAAGLVVGLMAGYAHLRYGSVQAGIAAAVGRPVTVVPETTDVGRVAPGGLAEGEIEVVNLTGEDVQVAFISMRCRCAGFRDLPLTIPPGKSGRIAFVLRAPPDPGHFKRDGVIRSSAGEARFVLAGNVAADR